MAIQFGTVDGLVNITKASISCFVKGIDEFVAQGGPAYAKRKGIPFGTAFQRFIDPVYTGKTGEYNLASIDNPVHTNAGTEQSPARGTFCKKMGLLKIDEPSDIYEITPLGKAILDNEITTEEYAFILLSKMGVFKDGVYADNLLNIISLYFQSNAIISQSFLKDFITWSFNDSNFTKTRFDIIINALAATGLVTKEKDGEYLISGPSAEILFADYRKRSKSLSIAEIDTSKEYGNYMGNLEYGGVFDVLSNDNIDIYTELFPNLRKYMKNKIVGEHQLNLAEDKPSLATFERMPLQQIYFGAPGTGKSYEINRLTDGKEVIRTTFHPDSDYSTFVGAYKPTSVEIPVRDVTGKVIIENGQKVTENRIVYEFVEQAFLQAYTKAWKAYANAESGAKPTEQYLVIEEINRGNCAQIFGDLFQLLDRNKYGFSDYPITADKDMKKQLAKAFKDLTIADASRINGIYKKDVVSQVLSGEILLLPDNLFIWATMNTSDQSLFPIDSAFKRRWDWKYIPISEGRTETGEKLGWKIRVGGNEYDWCQFMNKINHEIGEITKSEDKKIGYFFCKAYDGIISAETFVSKVIFYLWNDVFKDQDVANIFNDGDNELKFSDFYDATAQGKTIIREDKIEVFLKNLGLEPVEETNADDVEEDEEDIAEFEESIKKYEDYDPSLVNKNVLFVQYNGSNIQNKKVRDCYREVMSLIAQNEGVQKVASVIPHYLMQTPPEGSTMKFEPLAGQEGWFLATNFGRDQIAHILMRIKERLNIAIHSSLF